MFRTFYTFVTSAVLASSLAVLSAYAAGGCGPGFHRGPLGACVANAPVVVVAPVAPVVAAPAPAVVVAPAAPAVVVAPPVVCGRGFRWHPRVQALRRPLIALAS
jgi:hypothetical protein